MSTATAAMLSFDRHTSLYGPRVKCIGHDVWEISVGLEESTSKIVTEANHLDEIATRIRLLTYGQMMQLSAETGISAEAFYKWSQR